MNRLIISLLLLLFCEKSHSQGLLLVKNRSWDSNSLATPIEYSTASKFNTVFNVITSSGKSMRINSSLVVQDLMYSEIALPETVVTTTDIERLKSNLNIVEETISTWPRSAASLEKYRKQLKDALLKLENDQVLFSGRWIARAEHTKIIEDSVKASEELAQKHLDAQKARLAAEQAAEEKRLEEIQLKRTEQIRSLNSRKDTITKEIKGLQAHLDTTQIDKSDFSQVPEGVQKRSFLLLRKLPKVDFEMLYSLAPYVYECLGEGNERCILVSKNTSTMSNRRVFLWVTTSEDIDVTTKGGDLERATVFQEANDSVSMSLNSRDAQLQESLQMQNRTRDLLRKKTLELEQIEDSLLKI